MLKNAKKLIRDTRGASFVEYIVLVGVVALLAMAGFKSFGEKVKAAAEKQGNAVQQLAGK